MKKPPKIVLDLLKMVIGLGVAAILIRMVLKQGKADFLGAIGGSVYWLLVVAGLGIFAVIFGVRKVIGMFKGASK